MAMKTFVSLEPLLSEANMTLMGRAESGELEVELHDGTIGYISPETMLETVGVPKEALEKLQFEFNSPDTAMEISPLSAEQRARLTPSNAKGAFNYLKKEFGPENVSYSPEKGVVVNKEGIWHSIDPGILSSLMGRGDAWDITKELAADLGELTPTAVDIGAVAAGAAAGAAVGSVIPGVGTAIGAVVGAGAAAFGMSVLESYVGKAVGTYEATDEEILVDATMDALLTAGIYGVTGKLLGPGRKQALEQGVVPAGAKPQPKGIAKAFKNLEEKLPPQTKNIMRELQAKSTGSRIQNVERLWQRPNDVMGVFDDIAKNNPSAKTGDFIEEISKRRVDETLRFARDAKASLFRKFGQKERALKNAAPEGFAVDLQPHVESLIARFSELGIIGKMQASGNRLRQVSLKNKKELTKILQAGESDVSIFGTNATIKGLEEITRISNQILSKRGRASIDDVLKARRSLDKLLYKSSVFNNKAAMEELQPIVQGYRNTLAETFQRTSPKLGQLYDDMNNFYARNIDDIKILDKAMSNSTLKGYSRERAQTYTNYFENLERYNEQMELFKRLGENLGDDVVKQRAAKVLDYTAARDFTRYAPQVGVMSNVAIAGGTAAAIGLGMSPAIAIPAAVGGFVATSPRMAARATQAMVGRAARFAGNDYAARALPRMKFLNRWLKSMPPEQRMAALQDPAIATILAQMLVDIDTDDQAADMVLEQGGL